VSPPTRVGAVRLQLDVTRDALAVLFGVSRMTVQRWETDPDHLPQGLQLVVLECLETSLRAGAVTALRQIIRTAENDLGGSVWQLLNLKTAEAA
jgi:DNA-binding XRE family transcriptional regulator